MEEDIQEIKESLKRLESKVDLLVNQQLEVKERPLWLTFIIGFTVAVLCVPVLSAIIFAINWLYNAIFG
ncbi:MAG: hypothetical protein WDZ91_11875 [Paenibacillaceae bacterium]